VKEDSEAKEAERRSRAKEEADQVAAIDNLRRRISRARSIIRGDFTNSGKSASRAEALLDELEPLLKRMLKRRTSPTSK
jgi:hypothetical protein